MPKIKNVLVASFLFTVVALSGYSECRHNRASGSGQRDGAAVRAHASWQQSGLPAEPVELVVAAGALTTNEDGSVAQPTSIDATFRDGSMIRAAGTLIGANSARLAGTLRVTQATGSQSGFQGSLQVNRVTSSDDESVVAFDINGEVCR